MTRILASKLRFRNAVATAMLAVLSVALISTSLPVDKVSADDPDPDAEVTARANAWWAVLSDEERVRAGAGTNPNNISDTRRAALLDGTDAIIKEYVDGDATDGPGDVYGVGNHTVDEDNNTITEIRGFQSVDLWWDYMTCRERNIASGTTNTATTSGQGYCQNYSALDPTRRVQVNKVGMAINGLDEPTLASDEHITNAANWWNAMGGTGRVGILFGASAIYDSIGNVLYENLPVLIRKLVNDRWKYVYDEGGTDIEAWWNKLNCTQRLIAITIKSDTNLADAECADATYRDYVFVPEDNTDSPFASNRVERGTDLISYGTAILGLGQIPDYAAWWNAFSDTEKLYVIYGNPPVLYDKTDKTMTTELTDADREKVQKPYSELFTDAFDWGIAANTSILSTALETLMMRAGAEPDFCSSTNTRYHYLDNPCAPDQITVGTLVNHIAYDLWDPPLQDTPARPNLNGGTSLLDRFEPPYDAVYMWWQEKDCRSKRLALGEDHHDLDDEVMDNPDTEEDESMPAETSEYCKLYPGDPDAMGDSTQWLSYNAYRRVHEVARVLRVRLDDEIVRPPFNGYPSGEVLVHGPAVVGEAMMADISGVTDPEGIPENGVMYQWHRDGTPIPGATGSSYVLTTADAGAIISVNVSYTDLAYIREMISGRAGSQISVGAVSGGGISRIEPAIRSVTVSAGDEVVLQVNIYGLQGAQDQSLGNGVMFNWMQDGNSIDGMASSLTYTAPSSPGAYRVVASLDEEDCRPADRADFETDCSAEFEVRVRRPAAPQPMDEPPVNPPGEIPTILTDSQGAQYEVFTPVEGGTFDAGEGYSIMAPAGAVPNGEYIGVRMSDDGMASNAGVTSHRYTLGGNMYGIHAVDSTGASVTDYVLEDPARVCVPLPDVLRAQISDLALVTINSDNTLTILAANVRLGTSGTSVCGNLSNLPASVAVGSFGAPDAIPTATPEPTPIPPETGASSPSSNSAVWALLLGIAVLSLGSFIILGRRRGRIRA